MGIFRALTIILVRKGRISSKEGTVVKEGGDSFSGAGAATKAGTGSGREADVEDDGVIGGDWLG